MGEPWTQVPPRVEYEYLSDSSVEGKGMGYLHPVAVHKTRLGPDDDSSEEERLGLAALQVGQRRRGHPDGLSSSS